MRSLDCKAKLDAWDFAADPEPLMMVTGDPSNPLYRLRMSGIGGGRFLTQLPSQHDLMVWGVVAGCFPRIGLAPPGIVPQAWARLCRFQDKDPNLLELEAYNGTLTGIDSAVESFSWAKKINRASS